MGIACPMLPHGHQGQRTTPWRIAASISYFVFSVLFPGFMVLPTATALATNS